MRKFFMFSVSGVAVLTISFLVSAKLHSDGHLALERIVLAIGFIVTIALLGLGLVPTLMNPFNTD